MSSPFEMDDGIEQQQRIFARPKVTPKRSLESNVSKLDVLAASALGRSETSDCCLATCSSIAQETAGAPSRKRNPKAKGSPTSSTVSAHRDRTRGNSRSPVSQACCPQTGKTTNGSRKRVHAQLKPVKKPLRNSKEKAMIVDLLQRGAEPHELLTLLEKKPEQAKVSAGSAPSGSSARPITSDEENAQDGSKSRSTTRRWCHPRSRKRQRRLIDTELTPAAIDDEVIQADDEDETGKAIPVTQTNSVDSESDLFLPTKLSSQLKFGISKTVVRTDKIPPRRLRKLNQQYEQSIKSPLMKNSTCQVVLENNPFYKYGNPISPNPTTSQPATCSDTPKISSSPKEKETTQYSADESQVEDEDKAKSIELKCTKQVYSSPDEMSVDHDSTGNTSSHVSSSHEELTDIIDNVNSESGTSKRGSQTDYLGDDEASGDNDNNTAKLLRSNSKTFRRGTKKPRRFLRRHERANREPRDAGHQREPRERDRRSSRDESRRRR